MPLHEALDGRCHALPPWRSQQQRNRTVAATAARHTCPGAQGHSSTGSKVWEGPPSHRELAHACASGGPSLMIPTRLWEVNVPPHEAVDRDQAHVQSDDQVAQEQPPVHDGVMHPAVKEDGPEQNGCERRMQTRRCTTCDEVACCAPSSSKERTHTRAHAHTHSHTHSHTHTLTHIHTHTDTHINTHNNNAYTTTTTYTHTGTQDHAPAWPPRHHVPVCAVEAQRRGRQPVRDQVDPQQLHGREHLRTHQGAGMCRIPIGGRLGLCKEASWWAQQSYQFASYVSVVYPSPLHQHAPAGRKHQQAAGASGQHT